MSLIRQLVTLSCKLETEWPLVTQGLGVRVPIKTLNERSQEILVWKT